jgi:hypothetical protein
MTSASRECRGVLGDVTGTVHCCSPGCMFRNDVLSTIFTVFEYIHSNSVHAREAHRATGRLEPSVLSSGASECERGPAAGPSTATSTLETLVASCGCGCLWRSRSRLRKRVVAACEERSAGGWQSAISAAGGNLWLVATSKRTYCASGWGWGAVCVGGAGYLNVGGHWAGYHKRIM